MKKLLLLVFTLSTTFLYAQDLIKVKGNREVTTEISPLEPFETIEINGDFEIEIVPGPSPQVEITTDSNLHQYLAASVLDGKLVVTTTVKIRTKKEMKFRIVYGPNLKTIIVTDDAELSSITNLEFENLQLNIQKDAKVYLTASVNDLVLNVEGSSKSELNLTGQRAVINFKDKTRCEALIKYDNLEVNMKDSADAKIEGDINTGKLYLSDRSTFKGKNLVFKDLELLIKNKATGEVNVKSNLRLESDDDAETTVFNSPKIELKKLNGKSVLKKG
jgi:hypothetical protein